MREIKFRAWVEEILPEINGEPHMIYPGVFQLSATGNHDYFYADRKYKNDTCKFELMQYTGLKDASGKEIYEGDIVSHEDLEPSEVVYYPLRGFRVNSPLSVYAGSINWWTDDDGKVIFEVVGNIYENRELLDE